MSVYVQFVQYCLRNCTRDSLIYVLRMTLKKRIKTKERAISMSGANRATSTMTSAAVDTKNGPPARHA